MPSLDVGWYDVGLQKSNEKRKEKGTAELRMPVYTSISKDA